MCKVCANVTCDASVKKSQESGIWGGKFRGRFEGYPSNATPLKKNKNEGPTPDTSVSSMQGRKKNCLRGSLLTYQAASRPLLKKNTIAELVKEVAPVQRGSGSNPSCDVCFHTHTNIWAPPLIQFLNKSVSLKNR